MRALRIQRSSGKLAIPLPRMTRPPRSSRKRSATQASTFDGRGPASVEGLKTALPEGATLGVVNTANLASDGESALDSSPSAAPAKAGFLRWPWKWRPAVRPTLSDEELREAVRLHNPKLLQELHDITQRQV